MYPITKINTEHIAIIPVGHGQLLGFRGIWTYRELFFPWHGEVLKCVIGIVSLLTIALVDSGHSCWEMLLIACIRASILLSISIKHSHLERALKIVKTRRVLRAGGEQ